MKRFARGALTLAFWVAVWTALALLVNRELLLPAPWVVVRRLCELAATAAFWRITAVSIGRVLLGITAAAWPSRAPRPRPPTRCCARS